MEPETKNEVEVLSYKPNSWRCRLGWHKWEAWKLLYLKAPGVEGEVKFQFQERSCRRCGCYNLVWVKPVSKEIGEVK